MSVQVEHPADEVVAPRSQPPWRRRSWMVAAAVLLLGTTGIVVGLLVSDGGGTTLTPPKPVLGHARKPLPVYRRVEATRPQSPRQRVVPEQGLPGRDAILRPKPALNLHVRYAHVRPVLGRWQIEFIAPEGTTFNEATTRGRFFDVIVDGNALSLFFVDGSTDGTNFAIGGGANGMTEAKATAIARSLTTSVTVAHCTQSAIATNMCS